MKFFSYSVVFQEVPGEISLVFNITNCNYHCKGCHSEYLWEDTGYDFTEETLTKLLKRYKGLCTCVCFMGGDEEIAPFLPIVKEFGYKTCLYTGSDDFSRFEDLDLDFLKLGPYVEELGGLASKKTNQIFLKKNEENKYVDITKVFQEG